MTEAETIITPRAPIKSHPLVKILMARKVRYKVVYGGRGSGKSYAVADALLLRAYREPIRVLCTRELQNSIKESVHQLLKDRIAALGLTDGFTILENEIRGVCGSQFFFRGLRSNIQSVQSTQRIDYCWIEEAQMVCDDSFEKLIPSVREDDSELWITFNPQSEQDPVWRRFVAQKRDDVLAIKCNFTHNPFFPDVLKREMEFDRANFPARYKCVWEGEPTGYAGRIYPQYNDEVHVRDLLPDKLAVCDCYMSIDPHRKYLPAKVWGAVTPDNKLFIYNEWPTVDGFGGKFYDQLRTSEPLEMSYEQLAQIILTADMSAYGAVIKNRMIDPRFAAENPDYVQHLARYGVGGWVIPPYEKIEVQRNFLQQLLTYDKRLPITEYNEPSIYVCSWCRNTRRALQHHYWAEKTTSGREIEAEEYKDIIDAIRYMLAGMGGEIKHSSAQIAHVAAYDTFHPAGNDLVEATRSASLI